MDRRDMEQRITAAVHGLPAGRWAGYGEVAAMAGLRGRARLVARVLARSDDPAMPWHRVLRSDGRIAFDAGDPRHAEQAARLRAEGVVVVAGRARGGRVGPAPGGRDALDAALWGPG